MGDLAKNIGFLVAASEIGENHPIAVRIRSHRKINIAMELTAPGLQKVKSAIAIAPMKFMRVFDSLVVRIKVGGLDRACGKLFFQENCKSLRKAIVGILNDIHIIFTGGG